MFNMLPGSSHIFYEKKIRIYETKKERWKDKRKNWIKDKQIQRIITKMDWNIKFAFNGISFLLYILLLQFWA